jgi:hypothetical protein
LLVGPKGPRVPLLVMAHPQICHARFISRLPRQSHCARGLAFDCAG